MSYKVAVTTSDGIHVDQHFGQASSFQILQIEEETGEWEQIELRIVPEQDASNPCEGKTGGQTGGCHGHHDRHLDAVADMLADCTYLLTEKIGKKPYRILQQKGISSLESPSNLMVSIEKLNQYYLRNKR